MFSQPSIFFKSLFVWLISLLLILCCVSCAQPENQANTEDMVASIVAATLQSMNGSVLTETPEAPLQADSTPISVTVEVEVEMEATGLETATLEVSSSRPGILPKSVYFLSGENPVRFQVWRMETDGKTQTQLTSAEAGISDYDVSRVDGSVVFLSNNQMFWIDASGENQRLLVDGGAVDENSDTYQYHTKISMPRFSPDGKTLAYSQGGLLLMDLQSGANQMILENRLVEVEGSGTLPDELFYPDSWSPDGSKILVSIGWMEGMSYAILDVASQNLVYPSKESIMCCTTTWTADSQSVLISSRYMGMVDSGLWSFATGTGEVATLLGSSEGDYNYADWVVSLPNGDLKFFYRNSATAYIDNQDLTLKMVHSAANATNRNEIRKDEFSLVGALWAPDGSLALAILPREGGATYPEYGPLALVSTDGSPIQTLTSAAYQLRWGP